MSERALRLVKDDRGMSTAEYAIGTCGAAGLGGLLIQVLTSSETQNLLWDVVQKAFSWFTG